MAKLPQPVSVWYNPRCSKCRQARERLEAKGITPELYEYLSAAPSRSQLERVLSQLGTDDPRTITRTKEDTYTELSLGDATRDELLDALIAHPKLIERPIVVYGERAVVARPPEKLEELF